MKRIFPLLAFIVFLGEGCQVQKQSIGIMQHDEEVFAQFRRTPIRSVKMKKEKPIQYYAIPKDNSGNYRVTVTGFEGKWYDFVFLNDKLARAWVQVNTGLKNEWKSGRYYFRNGDLVYKEEQQDDLINLEEVMKVAEEYLQKAKTL